MHNWLTKLAEQPKSEDEVLREKIETLPDIMKNELLWTLDPSTRPTQMEDMEEKIANAERMGTELAHEHGATLAKQAFIGPLIAAAGRMAGGQALKSVAGGVAKDIAKDAVVGGVTKAVSSAVRPPAAAGGAMAPAMGGFSYGKTAGVNWSGLAQKGVGFLHRNPGAAMTLAGAGVGALMAPRDPQTGQKQYLRGAVMGGGLAAGANALSGGRFGDKMKQMITRQNNPILGQGVRRYVTESALATRPGGGGAAAALAKQAPAAPGAAVPAASYAGGPMEGTPKLASPAGLILQAAYRDKVANRQTLTYDPATKTFVRQHLTPDTTMGNTGSDVIPAGHTEPVAQGVAGRGQYAGQQAPGPMPRGGMAQTHMLHGGNVMSSSPAPGIAARPAAVPPPIPAAARAGGPGGLAAAAAKPRALPSLAGAVSLAKRR